MATPEDLRKASEASLRADMAKEREIEERKQRELEADPIARYVSPHGLVYVDAQGRPLRDEAGNLRRPAKSPFAGLTVSGKE